MSKSYQCYLVFVIKLIMNLIIVGCIHKFGINKFIKMQCVVFVFDSIISISGYLLNCRFRLVWRPMYASSARLVQLHYEMEVFKPNSD